MEADYDKKLINKPRALNKRPPIGVNHHNSSHVMGI